MRELHVSLRKKGKLKWQEIFLALSKIGWMRAHETELNFREIQLRVSDETETKEIDQCLQEVDGDMYVSIHERGEECKNENFCSVP